MNLCEKEAANKLGVAVQTLRNWRHIRRGPAYVKLGRSVRYREKDIAISSGNERTYHSDGRLYSRTPD